MFHLLVLKDYSAHKVDGMGVDTKMVSQQQVNAPAVPCTELHSHPLTRHSVSAA